MTCPGNKTKLNIMKIRTTRPLRANLGVMNPNLGVMNPNLGVMNPNLGVMNPNLGVMNPKVMNTKINSG
ncbi:MAG: hypothetical protein SPH02_08280 [Campylobacter sp.]|nr:hypothetical protein [Campylobacter sp.]